jgi:DNA-binding beta-propeller fold protein YncE
LEKKLIMKKSCFFAICCLAVFLSVNAPAWSQVLYATNEPGQQLAKLDFGAMTVSILYNIAARPDSLVVNSLGQIIYSLGNTGTIDLYDPSTGSNTILASGFTHPRDLVFDPGQNSLLVANFGKGEIDRLNLITGTWTPLTKLLKTVDGLAYDGQGNLFAVVNKHTQIAQIDPITGIVLKRLTVVTNQLYGWWGLDGLTFDPYTGQLWAADVGTPYNCLVEIPTDLSSFTLFQQGKLSNPDGLVADGNGSIFVSSAGNVYHYNIATDQLLTKLKLRGVDDVAMVPGS